MGMVEKWEVFLAITFYQGEEVITRKGLNSSSSAKTVVPNQWRRDKSMGGFRRTVVWFLLQACKHGV